MNGVAALFHRLVDEYLECLSVVVPKSSGVTVCQRIATHPEYHLLPLWYCCLSLLTTCLCYCSSRRVSDGQRKVSDRKGQVDRRSSELLYLKIVINTSGPDGVVTA